MCCGNVKEVGENNWFDQYEGVGCCNDEWCQFDGQQVIDDEYVGYCKYQGVGCVDVLGS